MTPPLQGKFWWIIYLLVFVNYHLCMFYKTTCCFGLPGFEVDLRMSYVITSFTQCHVLGFIHLDVHLQLISLHSCVVSHYKNIKMFMSSLLLLDIWFVSSLGLLWYDNVARNMTCLSPDARGGVSLWHTAGVVLPADVLFHVWHSYAVANCFPQWLYRKAPLSAVDERSRCSPSFSTCYGLHF